VTLDDKLIATQTCACQSVMFSNLLFLGIFKLMYAISGYGTFNTTVTLSGEGLKSSIPDLVTEYSLMMNLIQLHHRF
jgi:hypothetical protein